MFYKHNNMRREVNSKQSLLGKEICYNISFVFFSLKETIIKIILNYLIVFQFIPFGTEGDFMLYLHFMMVSPCYNKKWIHFNSLF